MNLNSVQTVSNPRMQIAKNSIAANGSPLDAPHRPWLPNLVKGFYAIYEIKTSIFSKKHIQLRSYQLSMFGEPFAFDEKCLAIFSIRHIKSLTSTEGFYTVIDQPQAHHILSDLFISKRTQKRRDISSYLDIPIRLLTQRDAQLLNEIVMESACWSFKDSNYNLIDRAFSNNKDDTFASRFIDESIFQFYLAKDDVANASFSKKLSDFPKAALTSRNRQYIHALLNTYAIPLIKVNKSKAEAVYQLWILINSASRLKEHAAASVFDRLNVSSSHTIKQLKGVRYHRCDPPYPSYPVTHILPKGLAYITHVKEDLLKEMPSFPLILVAIRVGFIEPYDALCYHGITEEDKVFITNEMIYC